MNLDLNRAHASLVETSAAIAALDPSKKKLVRAFPRNHWLHKMDWSLPDALGVDTKVIATDDH